MALGAASIGTLRLNPSITGGGGLTDIGPSVREVPHGSVDHGNTTLHREQVLSAPPVPLPDTGENTKLWKTLCEQYFAMFGIHPSFWVPMASLNFTGAAAIWLQSLHNCLAEFDWEAFTTLLCTRFGRDRHRFLI